MKMYPTEKSVSSATCPTNPAVKESKYSFAIGWALKESKPRILFTDKQKNFMMAKFSIGKTTGNKVDPYCAAEEMMMSGNFKKSEYLTGQQIASYFSKLAREDWKMSREDYNAALCEVKKEKLKCDIKTHLFIS